MIRQLSSDLESFKTLTFGPGLNLILADKSEGASDRQSRNGAGKTSFVELVHFIFGATVKPSSIFRSGALGNWTFSASVDICEETCSVYRSGKKPSRVHIDGDTEDWEVDRDDGLFPDRHELNNEQWKKTLGSLWFRLPEDGGSERFQPTFRSLFSFVARRQEDGGFQNPMQHSTMQQQWDQQATVCYLIGLDSTIPGRFQEVRGRERVARQLRKAAISGELGRYFGKAAELRTQLTVAEARTDRLRTQLDGFQVVPQYKEMEREASKITEDINSLNVENIVDLDLIRELRASLAVENTPDFQDLNKLYAEAGVVLPDVARRRIEEVERFHRTVIRNRRSHLGAEIDSAEQRIARRDRHKDELDQRRRQIMNVLRKGGALEHYTGMREELGRVEAESETIKERLEAAERFKSIRTELDMERTRLVKALRDDIHERDDIVREAILGFEELSRSLYENAGSLTIADTPNGPKFEVHIAGERSKGITNMQIFCFDLMLTEICSRHGRWPGFLIHDSHLFDGVDERQVAKALQLGAQRAEANDFQYIVTMNSDAVPTEGFAGGFDLRNHLVPTRLTDATETGGLFGFRF
ncbi:ABC-three component system protein [Candidatus Rariloculus sp.]|uniref:ABC-three component system protein n=1 Tax=Candidatus Rariloculus sp. TaxID=3101265 RepID=UPI003D123649